MSVEVYPLTLGGLALLVPEMTDDQWTEIEALGYEHDADRYAARLFLDTLGGRVLVVDGKPIYAAGVTHIRQGVVGTWAVHNDQLRDHSKFAARGTRHFLNELFQHGIHRVETVALAKREDAINWYRLLGLNFECRLPKHGVHGEDFVRFVRTE